MTTKEEKEIIKDSADLFASIKTICVAYFKENGLSQKTFNDVLLAFHVVSYELFDAFLKDKKECNSSSDNIARK